MPSHTHLNLGFLLLDHGAPDEGKAELKTAIELDPTLASRVGPGILTPAAPSASGTAGATGTRTP